MANTLEYQAGDSIVVRITHTKYHAIDATVIAVSGRDVTFRYASEAPIFAGLRGQLTLPTALRVK